MYVARVYLWFHCDIVPLFFFLRAVYFCLLFLLLYVFYLICVYFDSCKINDDVDHFASIIIRNYCGII